MKLVMPALAFFEIVPLFHFPRIFGLKSKRKSPSPSTSIRVSRVGDLPLSGGDALLPG
nr:hypothetical protein Q903MT_gene1550 [Picea sitchensis]